MEINIENYSSEGKVFPEPIGIIPGESTGEKAIKRTVEEKDFAAWEKVLIKGGVFVSVIKNKTPETSAQDKEDSSNSDKEDSKEEDSSAQDKEDSSKSKKTAKAKKGEK